MTFAFEHLGQRLRERHWAGRFFGGFFGGGRGIGQMTDQIYAGGRSRDKKPLLFVTDDENGLPRAERPRFEDVQFWRMPPLQRQALPVFVEPDAAEKNAEDNRQRAGDAQQRDAGIRHQGRGGGRIGALRKNSFRAEQKQRHQEKIKNPQPAAPASKTKIKNEGGGRRCGIKLIAPRLHAVTVWPSTSVIFTP